MEQGYKSDQKQKRRIEPFRSWLALLAAFYAQFLCASSEVFFSVCYIFLMEKYEASRAMVGIAASLGLSTGAIAGVVSSPFIDHYGCRRLMFVGTALTTIGFACSYTAPNIYCFHLFYGGFAGAGWILNAHIGHVVVQQAFTINRGLANGIAMMGLSAGTMLGPFFIKHFVNKYGVSGAMLLMAGIHAQMFFLVFTIASNVKHYQIQNIEIEVDDAKDAELILPVKYDHDGNISLKSSELHESAITQTNGMNGCKTLIDNISNNSDVHQDEGKDVSSTDKSSDGNIDEDRQSLTACDDNWRQRSQIFSISEKKSKDLPDNLAEEMHPGLTNINESCDKPINVKTNTAQELRGNDLAEDCDFLSSNETKTKIETHCTNEQSCQQSVQKDTRMRLNPFTWTLFQNRFFVMYMFVRFTWLACKYGMANHCVTAAITKGVPVSRAVYLPSVIGLGNLLLRILSSFLLNIKSLNKTVYFLIGIVCNMSAALVAALATNFEGMVVAVALVGINEGISTTSQPVVVLRMIGLEAFTRGFSIINLTMIPASIMAAPFYGYLADITGSYLVSFLVAFSSASISTCLVIAIIIMQFKMHNKIDKEINGNSSEATT